MYGQARRDVDAVRDRGDSVRKSLLLDCRLSARMAFRRLSILMFHGSDWERYAGAEPLNRNALGGRQAGKAPGFGPGIRRFESFPPSQAQGDLRELTDRMTIATRGN
jgi:hypothetical protein